LLPNFQALVYGEFTTATITGVSSYDPNAKAGSTGAGVQQFLSGSQAWPYIVDFENDASATAPAQAVTVTDQLDTTNFDLSTFSLGPVGFGSFEVVPPPGLTQYTTFIDMRPSTNLLVQVSGALNTTTGLATWTFQSLDPSTGLPPTDPTVGFLPPDVSPPQGDGSVLFTIKPKQAAITGTQIQNQATVVFDTNAPIATDTWFNTVDNTAPTSAVAALPATENSISFTVSWSGTDAGAGISSYTIYTSDNGGAFSLWLSNTSSTSATFTGVSGHTYGFYSIAIDNVGNVEAPKTVAEASTQVTAAAPVTPTVTVTPSSTSIPTTLALTVTVAVGSGSVNPIPTGSVTLAGGGFTSPPVTLSSGTATISIPAGSLAIGTDPLTVTYAPDAASSSTYNSATGSASVTIQGYPVITWPTPATISYGTALSATQLDATASVAGSFTYAPPSGTLLNKGLQTLTVSFNPTDTTDYLPVSASVTLQVNQASQTIVFTGLPATATYAAAGPYTLNATGGASGNPVIYGVTGPGSIIGSTLTIIGAGTVVVTASQLGTSVVSH